MRRCQHNKSLLRSLSTSGCLIVLVCMLLALCTDLDLSQVHATTKHGCAPATPPPISGSAVQAPTTPGIVVINEVLNQPQTTWNCSEPAGVVSLQEDSWVELYNTQAQPLELSTAQAELSIDGETSWQYLPSGSALAGGGFLVLFPLIDRTTPPPTTWHVVLAIGSTIIDQVTVPTLQPDQSYARVPDGSSTWEDTGTPTIDASNTLSNLPATTTPTRTPKPANTPNTSSATAVDPASTATLTEPPKANYGTQPPWGLIQLPTSTPTSTPVPGSTPGSSIAPAGSTNPPSATNGIALISITLLLLALAATIIWCWKLFHSP